MSSPEADLSPRGDLTTLSVTSYPGADVVSVAGELDIIYESLIRHVVSDETTVTQSQVILDLSSVTFIDASGMGAIVYSKRTLAGRSAELSLVCPEGHILRVLRLVAMERVLPIYPDRESALLQVSNGPDPRRRTSA